MMTIIINWMIMMMMIIITNILSQISNTRHSSVFFLWLENITVG